MPFRSSSNVSHVTQTDHQILRRPNSNNSVSPQTNDIKLDFFDSSNDLLPDLESKRALATALWFYLDRKGLPAPATFPGLLQPAAVAVSNDANTLTLLAAFYREKGQNSKAIDYFEKARSLPDAEESSLNGLLTLYYLSSRWQDALSCADRLIELDPGEARFHSLRADTLKQLGRIDEGIESAKRSLELDPTVVPVRDWLVKALLKTSQTDEYELQLKLLQRIMETEKHRADTNRASLKAGQQ